MNVKISFRHEFQERISALKKQHKEDIAETKRKQEETLNVHQELSNTQLAEQLQAVADAQKALADAEEASKISAKDLKQKLEASAAQLADEQKKRKAAEDYLALEIEARNKAEMGSVLNMKKKEQAEKALAEEKTLHQQVVKNAVVAEETLKGKVKEAEAQLQKIAVDMTQLQQAHQKAIKVLMSSPGWQLPSWRQRRRTASWHRMLWLLKRRRVSWLRLPCLLR